MGARPSMEMRGQGLVGGAASRFQHRRVRVGDRPGDGAAGAGRGRPRAAVRSAPLAVLPVVGLTGGGAGGFARGGSGRWRSAAARGVSAGPRTCRVTGGPQQQRRRCTAQNRARPRQPANAAMIPEARRPIPEVKRPVPEVKRAADRGLPPGGGCASATAVSWRRCSSAPPWPGPGSAPAATGSPSHPAWPGRTSGSPRAACRGSAWRSAAGRCAAAGACGAGAALVGQHIVVVGLMLAAEAGRGLPAFPAPARRA